MELTELQIYRRLVLKLLLAILYSVVTRLDEQESKLVSEVKHYLKVD